MAARGRWWWRRRLVVNHASTDSLLSSTIQGKQSRCCLHCDTIAVRIYIYKLLNILSCNFAQNAVWYAHHSRAYLENSRILFCK